MRFRRTTTLALVVAMLAVPTTAFADDDVADTGGTDRPAATDTQRDTIRDRTFEAAKERALETIEHQLRALDGLASKVANSRFITDAHAAELRSDIAAAIGGLEVLSREIEASENWAELRPLLGHIDDWKIAQVLAPKTAQVIVSDALVVGARKLSSFAGVLDNVIGRFEAAGYDVDEAWRMLDEMNDLIAEGERLADPVAESVIGLTAADWPDPAQSVLAAGREDLHEAGGALRSARAHGVDIVQFLRSLFDGQLDVTAQVDAAA